MITMKETLASPKDAFDHKCEQALCRTCNHSGLQPVLDLGNMPLADGLLSEGQLVMEEGRFPLEVAFCPECSLVQILETVPPDQLFCDEYPYYSSFSETLLQHSRENVLSLIERDQLNSNSFVVEIASNDGYLLKNFVEHQIPVLGIDPAEGPAQAAEKIGVPTMNTFFSEDLARHLVAKGTRADIIIANNVLAHVADVHGFIRGIAQLLKETGTAVIEVPYVRDLIDHFEFDTIYHEHLCYFSVTAIDHLFRRHGLYLNHVKRIAIHGGSLRLFINRFEEVSDSVTDLLREERELGVDSYEYYQEFSRKVGDLRDQLNTLLDQLKSSGKRIAAYGAAAKGTIMLNYIGAHHEIIDFAVDRNVYKQGKYIPGVRIPIYDPARLMEEMPDYVLLLPWNFKTEILQQQEKYRKAGGHFIIPIPRPEIV